MSTKPLDLVWFEHLLPTQARVPRLFCFPFAGASAEIFRSWQRHFRSEVDLCLVHFPGRGRRISEPPFTTLKCLVEAIATRMSHELEHPFAFYGHSMGALIGFELSRECYRRYNVGPLQLFVSGRGPKGRNTGSPIFTLPDDDFVAELRRLNGTPKELLAN